MASKKTHNNLPILRGSQRSNPSIPPPSTTPAGVTTSINQPSWPKTQSIKTAEPVEDPMARLAKAMEENTAATKENTAATKENTQATTAIIAEQLASIEALTAQVRKLESQLMSHGGVRGEALEAVAVEASLTTQSQTTSLTPMQQNDYDSAFNVLSSWAGGDTAKQDAMQCYLHWCLSSFNNNASGAVHRDKIIFPESTWEVLWDIPLAAFNIIPFRKAIKCGGNPFSQHNTPSQAILDRLYLHIKASENAHRPWREIQREREQKRYTRSRDGLKSLANQMTNDPAHAISLEKRFIVCNFNQCDTLDLRGLDITLNAKLSEMLTNPALRADKGYKPTIEDYPFNHLTTIISDDPDISRYMQIRAGLLKHFNYNDKIFSNISIWMTAKPERQRDRMDAIEQLIECRDAGHSTLDWSRYNLDGMPDVHNRLFDDIDQLILNTSGSHGLSLPLQYSAPKDTPIYITLKSVLPETKLQFYGTTKLNPTHKRNVHLIFESSLATVNIDKTSYGIIPSINAPRKPRKGALKAAKAKQIEESQLIIHSIKGSASLLKHLLENQLDLIKLDDNIRQSIMKEIDLHKEQGTLAGRTFTINKLKTNFTVSAETTEEVLPAKALAGHDDNGTIIDAKIE